MGQGHRRCSYDLQCSKLNLEKARLAETRRIQESAASVFCASFVGPRANFHSFGSHRPNVSQGRHVNHTAFTTFCQLASGVWVPDFGENAYLFLSWGFPCFASEHKFEGIGIKRHRYFIGGYGRQLEEHNSSPSAMQRGTNILSASKRSLLEKRSD